MASFMLAPEPAGPRCSTRRHIWSRIGLARSKSAFSAPARPKSLPSFAGPVVQPTGHATRGALGAAYRSFDARLSFSFYLFRKLLRRSGTHGTHLDEELSLRLAFQHGVVDRFDRLCIGQDRDHRFAAGDQRLGRLGHLAAG